MSVKQRSVNISCCMCAGRLLAHSAIRRRVRGAGPLLVWGLFCRGELSCAVAPVAMVARQSAEDAATAVSVPLASRKHATCP